MKKWQLIVCFFILLMALFPFDFGGYDLPMQRTLDGGHFVAFALLAYIVFAFLKNKAVRFPNLLSLFVCVSIIVSIELLQPLMGRSATLMDIWNSVAGVLVVLVGIHLWQSKPAQWLRYSYAFLAIMLCSTAFYPAVVAWYAEWWRSSSFPVLGVFENELELQLWKERGENQYGKSVIRLSEERSTEGKQSLRVDAIHGDWSGVRYVAGHKSWEGYSHLVFDLYNPGDTFTLELRIDDDRHNPSFKERFTKYLSVNNGVNHYSISVADIKHSTEKGLLNIESIAKFLLVIDKDDISRTFYLDKVRLVK